MRDIKRPGAVATDQLMRVALICDACYGSFDVATRCLAELERRGACPAGTAGRYLESLRGRSRRVVTHELPGWT